ncbi:MAG: hypothetical protein HQK65_18145 [Desulfamplus sp.]|nr:hypothetical protein [Desulfamplus sp.]
MMTRKSIIVILSFFLTACAPAIKPELVKKVDGYYNTTTSKSYKTSKKFKKAIPYAVGQYVITGTTDDKGRRSITKTSVVGRQSGGWILEIYSVTPSSESTTQMLIKGIDSVYQTGNLDNLDIIWVKMKSEDGSIQTIDGPALQFTKALYRKALSGLELDLTMLEDGGTITVPAGLFKGTTKSTSTGSFLGMTFSADSWYHPDVPVNGVVKLVSKKDKMAMELLKFGLSGAEKSF